MSYETVIYESIVVCFAPELVGGGEQYGQDYLTQVARHIGPVDRLFEWCAGPGFIGFSLLAHGLCRSLCLADINPTAVAACQETVHRNGLGERVTVYRSDGLDAIPPTERWDLVVGNPPHSGTDKVLPWGHPRIYQDIGWDLHRRFYAEVGRFLKPGAQVLIQENRDLSTAETFRPMLAAGGLAFVGTLPCPIDPHIYYLWTRRSPGTAPALPLSTFV